MFHNGVDFCSHWSIGFPTKTTFVTLIFTTIIATRSEAIHSVDLFMQKDAQAPGHKPLTCKHCNRRLLQVRNRRHSKHSYVVRYVLVFAKALNTGRSHNLTTKGLQKKRTGKCEQRAQLKTEYLKGKTNNVEAKYQKASKYTRNYENPAE